MKRTLLFMACVLASLTMSAQENSYFDYVPFVKEGKKWHVVHTEFGTNYHREQYVFRNENVTKTGKTYMTMYRTEDVFMVTYDEEALHKVGFYREEGRKIYNFDDNMQEEHLLFDYSLKEGDSYETYSYEEQKMVTYKVLSVRDYAEGPKVVRYTQEADSMRAEYRYLRKWTVCRADDNTLQKTWIEGVGSIEGPLASLQDEYPISCRDYLAYVEFPDYYRFDNPYLPFSFYDTMNKQIHGCNLPKTSSSIPEPMLSQLTYELEGNRLHIYGKLVFSVSDNYAYFIEEPTDDPLVHKLRFEIQTIGVGQPTTAVGLFTTDFYVPGFDPNMNYIVIDSDGEEHPVINKTPQMAYRPFVEDNKEWTMVYMGAVPPEYQHTFSYEQIKLGSALEVDGMTFKQIVSSSWWNDQDGPSNWTETDEYLGEADGKMYLYNKKSQNTVQIMDFTLQVGDTYRQMQMGDSNHYMDFVVTAVTDTVIATSSDKTPRKCLYLSRPGSTNIDDVWIEGIGSLVGGVYGSLVQLMAGAIPTLRTCQQDGQTLYEAYHPFLKEGKTWNFEDRYYDHENKEEWTKYVSYVINGTTEIDGKTYYKMYRVSEEGSEYYCALREEDKKVWTYSSDDGEKLLYDFNMSAGDSYMPVNEWNVFHLTEVKPVRFNYSLLLNVQHFVVHRLLEDWNIPVVEGVGCSKGWELARVFWQYPTGDIIDIENFVSCYEDGKCIFTVDDFENIPTPKPVDDMAYRPFVEEGKVWKVGTIPSSPDSPVQIVDYYYLDGDTIVDGKTCKQMWCQRFVSPDYPDYSALTQTPSLSKVGAWYEEDKKVYVCREGTQGMEMLYDFSLEANDTLILNDYQPYYIVGPKQTGGLKGFKGVYRDIMIAQNGDYCTTWLEGVGGIDGPLRNVYPETGSDPQFLMSCTVGDEVIYLNDEYEDGATPEGMIALKKRFDFTHTTKLQPKAPIKRENSDASISSSEREVARPKVKVPKRSGEEQTVYGEYSALQLGIHLDPLDDAYQVSITNESGKVVYEKTINAGTIVGLSIDISAYAKGRYTVTVENSNELFTGEFETETTGIEETMYNKVEAKSEIYNLQGQRIHSLQKGLNIYGGRKIVK